MTDRQQARLKGFCKATWSKTGIHQLRIKISADPWDLLADNILEYKARMNQLLQNWQKLPLSWWGRKAVIQMQLLPVLLVFFQNLLIIPMSCIDEIQGMFNKYLCHGIQQRVKMSLLHQSSINGGISLPSVKKYYLASRLVAIKSWWHDMGS